MSLDLRPLSVGELFDRAFMLYRRHFWLFVGIAAVPGVFALLITIGQLGFQEMVAGNAAASPEELERNVVALMWMVAGMLLVTLCYLIVYMIALGATTVAVSELYLGRGAEIADSYRRIRGRIGNLLLLMLLIGLRLAGVALAAVVIGLIGIAAVGPIFGALLMMLFLFAAFIVIVVLSLRYGVAVPALMLEQLSASRALKRSVELTQNRLGRVFLLVVCATLINYAVLVLFQGPFFAASWMAGFDSAAGLWLSIAGAVSGSIGTTLTAPFMIIGLALIYYDARIREEGFDLEMRLSTLDGATDPARA